MLQADNWRSAVKVLFDYDEQSGSIRDATNAIIGTFYNAMPFPDNKINGTSNKYFSTADLVKLKKAGFTAAEIADLESQRE